MKFTRQMFSSVSCLCAVIAFSLAAASPVLSQGQPPSSLLKLKTSVREIQIFENGTVIETRNGIKTERRLSEGRMRKLQKVIARAPCQKEWGQPPQPLPDLSRVQSMAVQPGTYNGDCVSMWLSYGLGLQEIQVTLKYPERQIGPFPVYVVCDGSKKKYKESARRNYQNFLKPNWRRFIDDVVSAIGSKSILKGCNSWQS